MADSSPDLARQIRKEAARLGFAATGFSAPLPQSLSMQRLTTMIQEKRHGEMNYMEKRMVERADPSVLLPGLRTIISTAISYNYPLQYQDGFPKISKYALIDDYHTIVREKLEKLLSTIKILLGEPLEALIAVDSSPLFEKNWAEDAGIGKTGKNTLLKVPSAGSYLFLGEILLNREIRSPGITLPNFCGSCSNCLEHCPTGAFVEPGKIDASKCISYLTVELKREFTAEEATKIGDRIFGCDICQEVCPYNQQASIPAHESFRVRTELLNISTEQILNLTRSGFRELFYGTPVFRIGLRRLKRNARAVAENLKRSGKIPSV
ncbi:MAG: tRNA epoxyqueuosine(34) reductase QueG [Chlorobium sp.]|nr:MAG: tRNA epoxyqueuosine(34) reductase QueG [Chlorobium sp.]